MIGVKYPKIIAEKYLSEFDLTPKGFFYVEEKYDGSQFRFGVEHGKRWFGSKSVTFSDMQPSNKSFAKAVENANKGLDKIELDEKKDYVFFGEYLEKPKHNTLTYDRVPLNNIVLFDILIDNKYQVPDDVIATASAMELEPVSLIKRFRVFPPYKEITQLIKRVSTLGGSEIEGAVIKNYDILIEVNGSIRPLLYKIVRDDFKELNNKEWNKQPKTSNALDAIEKTFNKEAIFRKAVQHLNDDGEATGELKDIGKLIPLVYEDLEKEYMPVVKEILYKHFEKDIQRTLVRGLPEYYKEYLYKKMESAINK